MYSRGELLSEDETQHRPDLVVLLRERNDCDTEARTEERGDEGAELRERREGGRWAGDEGESEGGCESESESDVGGPSPPPLPHTTPHHATHNRADVFSQLLRRAVPAPVGVNADHGPIKVDTDARDAVAAQRLR